MTSYWARWRLKSPASRLFSQLLFTRRSKKTSKLRVTALCAGNSPVTGEFSAQMASNAGNVSIWWRHHVFVHGPLSHDVQFSCAITQPLLAHHWRVHQCLLTLRFITPSIPWGVSAPGGKMRKQLLKDHNFLNNSPIFTLEVLLLIYLLFKKHCIRYISIWKIVLDLVKGTWHHHFMAGCGSLLWANTCSLWSGMKSWPGAGCLQRMVRRRWQ